MSEIKVDALSTVSGSGSITVSNNLTASGVVGVNGGTGGQVAVNYTTASTTGLKLNDTNSGNLGGYIDFRSGAGAGTQRATIQNANNAGIHVNVGTGGSLSFGTGYTAANALDDYEEGTWTPEVSSVNAHHSRTGIYTKIGNMVHIQCVVHFTQAGTTFGSLSGLPYVVADVNYSPLTFREWYSTGITLSGNLVIGGQSTTGFWNYANSSTAVNNQQYGYAISTTYRTS